MGTHLGNFLIDDGGLRCPFWCVRLIVHSIDRHSQGHHVRIVLMLLHVLGKLTLFFHAHQHGSCTINILRLKRGHLWVVHDFSLRHF